MPSVRQIRSRLKSIHSTKQIMRAMQLVSASKLKRAQDRMLQARSTMGFLDGLLQRVLAATGPISHPLCAAHDAKPNLLVVVTSDAGLCGSYNSGLIQLAEATVKRDTFQRTQLMYIGRKGSRYFTRRGYQAVESYLDLAGRPDLAKAEAIARKTMGYFTGGQVGAVHVLYARHVSAAVSKPTLMQWLPIRLEPAASKTTDEYIFEPSPQRVFEDLLPRWTLAKFQLILLEAFTSEHSARMVAMKNATDNAEELLKSLTLQRNKIRQAAITKELSEIVGTVEALK